MKSENKTNEFRNMKEKAFQTALLKEKRKNKRGFLRIVEAVFAVLIIMGFVLLVASGQMQKPDVSDTAYTIQHQILREIADNYTLRNDALQNETSRIKDYVDERISPFPMYFSVSVCSPEKTCLCEGCPGDREIFADDILISTNLTDYKEKRISLFTWTA